MSEPILLETLGTWAVRITNTFHWIMHLNTSIQSALAKLGEETTINNNLFKEIVDYSLSAHKKESSKKHPILTLIVRT